MPTRKYAMPKPRQTPNVVSPKTTSPPSSTRSGSVISTMTAQSSSPLRAKPGLLRVVIIGGGFAGLQAACSLWKKQGGSGRPMHVTLIDKTNHHLFQPLLYQVASAALSPSDIAQPIREIVAGKQHVHVVMGDVTTIDTDENMVHIASGESFEFEYLVVASGSRHCYFGNDQWESVAPGLKTLDDAIHIRHKILMAFEKAERLASLGKCAAATGALNFVVVGGGPTGVEMAGAIAEIANKTMLKNFRHINPKEARVTIVESADQLLATYPPDLAESARQSLFSLGIGVRLATRVVDVRPDGVTLSSGETIASDTVIWAAGNVASPLVQQLGAPLVGRSCRVQVQADCSLPDKPHIFVIGDAAYFDHTATGEPLPGVVQVAKQQASYVANIINRNISDARGHQPFSYFDKGTMATIGRAHAVVWLNDYLKFTGFIAWVMWAFIHVFFLIDFRSKIVVTAQWIFLYLTGGRGARLINVKSDCGTHPELDLSTTVVPPALMPS